MRKMFSNKVAPVWIRRGETGPCDAPSRRWQGEKTRLDDFLTRTRICDEWDDTN